MQCINKLYLCINEFRLRHWEKPTRLPPILGELKKIIIMSLSCFCLSWRARAFCYHTYTPLGAVTVCFSTHSVKCQSPEGMPDIPTPNQITGSQMLFNNLLGDSPPRGQWCEECFHAMTSSSIRLFVYRQNGRSDRLEFELELEHSLFEKNKYTIYMTRSTWLDW